MSIILFLSEYFLEVVVASGETYSSCKVMSETEILSFTKKYRVDDFSKFLKNNDYYLDPILLNYNFL